MAKSQSPASSDLGAPLVPQPGRDLKRALRSGRVLVGGMLTEYVRPSLVKLYVQAGFDFLYIEYEHGYFDQTTLGDTVQCARDNGLPVIAKTPQLERAEVAKLLDCGIVGIQLPRTETREEIETLRSYMKFPPDGTRAVAPGWGNSSYVPPKNWQQWMDDQDNETTLVVHIETRRAFENAEQIVSTPGVDMVYVGPGDSSVELGHPGQFDHPEVAGPIEEVLKLCQRYDVPFGTTASNNETAGEWIAKGTRFFEAVDELSMILQTATKLVADYRRRASELGVGDEGR